MLAGLAVAIFVVVYAIFRPAEVRARVRPFLAGLWPAVLTAGAASNMEIDWSEFIPIYRTPAGTGLGAAFACWRPD